MRRIVEGHGQKRTRFPAQDTASEQAFPKAAGVVEFTTDAGKVNTREQGGKDLKIGVMAKREAGVPASAEQGKSRRLPAATIVRAFARIATSKAFRRTWRPRWRRLGVTCWASVPVLADDARWIGKAVPRALAGCLPTLAFAHACQHLHRCVERLFGEGSREQRAA